MAGRGHSLEGAGSRGETRPRTKSGHVTPEVCHHVGWAGRYSSLWPRQASDSHRLPPPSDPEAPPPGGRAQTTVPGGLFLGQVSLSRVYRAPPPRHLPGKQRDRVLFQAGLQAWGLGRRPRSCPHPRPQQFLCSPAAPPLQIPLGPLGHWAVSSLSVFWMSRGVTLSGQVGPGELVPSAHSSWPRGTQSRAVVCALTGKGRGWGGWVAQGSTTDCKWGSGRWGSGGFGGPRVATTPGLRLGCSSSWAAAAP